MSGPTQNGNSISPVDLSIKHLAWAVIEAMQDSLVVTNPDGSIIYLNHAAESLLNVTFTSVFGRRLDQVMSLVPVGPRRVPGHYAPFDHPAAFNASQMQGYWLLRLGNDFPLVNIGVSSLPPDSRGSSNLLFTIRRIREEGAELEPILSPASERAQVDHEEFHKRIRNALRASQRWNLEHCLLCVQFDMAHPEPGENEALVSMLQRYVRRTDASCLLGARKYAVLLEGHSLPQAIRRAFDIIRELTGALSDDRCRRRDLNIWIGVTPVNRFGPSDSANYIGMAMQACYEARQQGKGTAVRVFRPGREPVNTTPHLKSPWKGHSE